MVGFNLNNLNNGYCKINGNQFHYWPKLKLIFHSKFSFPEIFNQMFLKYWHRFFWKTTILFSVREIHFCLCIQCSLIGLKSKVERWMQSVFIGNSRPQSLRKDQQKAKNPGEAKWSFFFPGCLPQFHLFSLTHNETVALLCCSRYNMKAHWEKKTEQQRSDPLSATKAQQVSLYNAKLAAIQCPSNWVCILSILPPCTL